VIALGHAALGILASLVLWRALAQGWVDQAAGDVLSASVLRFGIPTMTAVASGLAIALGRIHGRQRSALVADAISVGCLFVLIFAFALGSLGRDIVGLVFVAGVVVRFAPAGWLATRAASSLLLFLLAFSVFAFLAAWHQANSLPLGDQVHYLLAADRLAHGSLDATLDPALFRRLTTIDPTDADVATHVVNVAAGARTVQGYALPLLLLPGWVFAGRFGAELVVALAAAWTAAMTALILRDTIADARIRGGVWAMTAFLPPLVLLATAIYPNSFGAAIIATAYRVGFTAPARRPALAGAIAALTLFLNPRDGLVLLVLVATSAWYGRAHLVRFGGATVVVAVLVIVSNALIYGIPLPYAGYFFGTSQAQALTNEPSLTFRFWVGLPAMLFDRTFGVAGSAPWLFIALIGVVPALRAAPRALVPAAATVVASLAALSLYRYWEGGYAPPNRYLVEVLPLLAPFVAHGLIVARAWWLRVVVGLLIAMSALASLLLSAMPARALNDPFQQQLQDLFDVALGINPLGWLPSFIPTTPDWYVGAYLRLVPALAIAAGLLWYGARMRLRAWR
jgi:hypothetical protein